MENKKSRKGIAVIIIAAFAVMAAGFLLQHFCGDENKVQSKTIFAMDTACTLSVYDNDEYDFTVLTDTIKKLDSLLSAYNDSSEIFSLNEKGYGRVSDETLSLIEKSVSLTSEYGFADITVGGITKLWNVTGDNPTVPSDDEISQALKTCGDENIEISNNDVQLKNGAQLDFGAVGKGYALDSIKKILDSQNVSGGVISFRSSSLLYGKKPDGEPFEISVSDPDDDSSSVLSFSTDGGFVSTSGGYERYFEAQGKKYSHIFDIATGRPAQTDLTSVTVICDSGIKSDFLSTCIYIGTTKNLQKYLDDESIQIICIDDKKNIYVSDSLRKSIRLNNAEYSIK